MLVIPSGDYLTPEQCAHIKSEIPLVADDLPWGTYGPDLSTGQLTTRKLGELDTDHLENILMTQAHLWPSYKAAILHILKKRYQAQSPGV